MSEDGSNNNNNGNASAPESAVPSAPAKSNIADFTPSLGDKVRAQAARSEAAKERASSIVDEAWDEIAPAVQAVKESNTEETFEVSHNPEHDDGNAEGNDGEVAKGDEESERTFEDVIDEAWEDEHGEPKIEEASTEESGDDETDESDVEGEETLESDEEVRADREDVILASFEGEDGESQQLEIPKNAKITVKVDGEDQEISMQDFANGISGQKAISQKFSALNGEQKAFDTRLNDWNTSSAKAVELMQDNKAVEAIQHVAGMMGQDPQLLFTTLFEEITPILNQYADLSETDRGVWVQDLKNKKAEFQTKSAQNELSKLQSQQEQQAKVSKVQEAYGLDEATFTHVYHALENEMEQGTLPKQPVTPELVGEYSRLLTIEGYAERALKGTEHEGDHTAVNQILQAANQMARNGQEVSEQSVKDLVSKALGRTQQVEKSKAVNESLKKKGVKLKSKGDKKPVKRVQRANPQDKPMNWMDRAMTDLDNGANPSDIGLRPKRP